MGSSLSVCGFGDSDGDHDAQLYHESKDFAQDFDRLAAERKRSLSMTTDSSVASILSNSDQLIPDVFLPKDIQVLSQRRQRQHHHSKNSSMGSSRVSNSSYRGVGSVHVARNAADKIPGSVNKAYEFGIKTASSSFGYSDDESNNPVVVSNAVICLPRIIK
ncbi:hypothetical protein KXD40_007552 [Peronospora effusa]|uniref:Uncharacterized protein n=1 Tax=Peronospora effusa TaxID=542832 RepID=A0A3M6V9H1_9STRA|nr:hypothetical protein DD238_007467 [Peronospora effusa]RQM11562.1 hypothetical protein DD237_007725 [Peronospora effusa]UIZ28829.1 hypothetical protein KXD40_007552 [Peronospora effusa]CAI5704062.1 unnamed protein product [Peronospora effusa]